MICRSLSDSDFVIVDPLPDDIPDEAAELIAAALVEMIEAADQADDAADTSDHPEGVRS